MTGTSDAAAVGAISHILQTAFKDVYDENKHKEEALRAQAEHAAKKEARCLRKEAAAAAAGDDGGAAEGSGGEEENKEDASVASTTPEPSPTRLGKVLPNLQAALEQRQAALDVELVTKLGTANRLKEYLVQEKTKAFEAELVEEEELKKQGIMIGQHIPPLPSKLAVSAAQLSQYGAFSANLQVAREMVEANTENMLRRTGNLPISDLAEQKKADRAAKVKSGADARKPHYVQNTATMAIKQDRSQKRYAVITEARRLEDTKKYSETGGVKPQYQPQYQKIPDQLTGDEVEASLAIQRRMDHKLNYLRNPRNLYTSTDQVLTINQNAYTMDNKELTRMAGTSGPGYGPDGVPLSLGPQKKDVKLTSDDMAEAAKAMAALSGMGKKKVSRPASPDAYEQDKLSPGGRARAAKERERTRLAADYDGMASDASSTFDGGFGMQVEDKKQKIALPLFRSEPAEILFDEFEVGAAFTVPITFTNISRASRIVRVIPPGAPQFSLAPLKYPVNSKAGMCAPGMCVSSVLTFYPENLADVVDGLTVETESGSYVVPIVARRDSPKLSMPPMLNVGTCMVGDATRVQVYCQNTGGAGKFRLVRHEDFDAATGKVVNGPTFGGDTNPNNNAHPNDEPDWDSLGCLRMSPFTVYPVRFDLQKMDSVNIIVEFVPLELCRPDKPFTHKFYILSDNLQVFEYTLYGRSRQLDCYVSEINSSAFDHTNKQVRREVFFEAANIGIEQSQQIVVTNDSGLPVEYEWVWLDPATRKGRPITDERDLTAAGRARLVESEKKQLEWGDNAPTMAPSPMGTAENDAVHAEELGRVEPEDEPTVMIAGFQVSPLDKPGAPAQEEKPQTALSTNVFTPATASSAMSKTGRKNKPNKHLRPLSGTPVESRARNSVVEKSFELSPARGVLGTDGAETFTITFVPSSVPLATMQAVLMLKNVPEVAVQNDYQGSLLSRLKHDGHGHFMRLLSWIDQMAERAEVTPYIPAQSQELVSSQEIPAAAKTKLINLQTILDLVYRNGSGYVLPSDLFAVERAARLILAHVHMWKKRELEFDEEEPAEEHDASAHDAPEDDVQLPLFMWEGPDGTAPVPVEPMSLRHSKIDLDEIYAMYAEDAEKMRIEALGEEYDADAEAAAKAAQEEELLKNPAPVQPLAMHGEPLVFSLPLLHALREGKEKEHDMLGIPVLQGEFVAAESRLLAHVWMEPEAALHMLGRYVNEVLDMQVKHEAVDYLREKALQTVSCLTFNAAGEGKPQVVRVTPPLLSVGGMLPIEQTWKGQVRLVNTSTAMAEVEFRPDQMEIVCLGTDGRRREEDVLVDFITSKGAVPGLPVISEEGSQVSAGAARMALGQGSLIGEGSVVSLQQASLAAQTSVISEVDASKIQIEFDPPRILLMPEADATVDVYATVFCLGRYEVSIPIKSSSTAGSSQGGEEVGGAQVDRVHLSFQSCGPRLRFLNPEVDLGLVGVGGVTSTTFSFVNEGASTASFDLMALSEEQMNAIIEEKANSIGPNGRPRSRAAITGGRSLEEGSVEGSSVGPEGSMAGFSAAGRSSIQDSEKLAATLSVEPATGTAAPGEKITVTLTCKAGANPQRVRGCVRSRIGSALKEVDSTPDQYVGFRCEVQAPKTILYPMKINVGDVYTGVPVYFDITTENICNLPTSYNLERPGLDEFSDFKLTFDQPSGPLGAKEKVTIRCEFVALEAGAINNELIANKIKGVPTPLGFVISGMARAPLVDLWPLDGSVKPFVAGKVTPNTSVPSSRRNSADVPAQTGVYANLPFMPIPLARPTDIRYPHATPVPVPLPVKQLVFTSPPPPGKEAEADLSAEESEVALYERCVQQFAIRNLSAVPVSFSLDVMKFGVGDSVGIAQLSGGSNGGDAPAPGKTGTATATRAANGTLKSKIGTAAIKQQASLLLPHEDGANKFHSVGGQKHAEASVQRRENRLFLTSGLGASYLVYTDATRVDRLTAPLPGGVALPDAQPNERAGYIDPWGVALVTIRTFNDMPGKYDDALLVQFKDLLGLAWTTQVQVPLRMTVTGCPLTIDKSTYGMTKEKLTIYKSLEEAAATTVPKAATRTQARDMLSFGVNTFHSEPITRELYVQNNGSMPGQVTWRIRGVANGNLNVPSEPEGEEASLGTAEEEALKDEIKANTVLRFWSDNAKEPAFKVEPQDAIIAPYGKQKFRVTLFRTSIESADNDNGSINSHSVHDEKDGEGAVDLDLTETAQLIGDVQFVKGEKGSSSSEKEKGSSPSPTDQAYRINLLLQGKLVYPTILIDKKTFTATTSDTVLRMEDGGIKFKSQANGIFGMRDKKGRRGNSEAGQECNKIITLVNPLETILVCSVSTEGQFALKLAVDDTHASSEKAQGGTQAVMSKTTKPVQTAVGASSAGRIITLLPRASASFVLAFQPSRGLRETVTAPKLATAATGSNEEEGQLIISFNTGQRLFLPLLGSVATPFLVGSAPALQFGTCQVGMSTEGTMLVSNPTTVLARWVVKHVPVPNDLRNARKKENEKVKIKVPGYDYPPPETDDPSVFLLTPSAGSVAGPTVSVVATIAAPPKDFNREGVALEVVPQRLSQTSWATETLNLKDQMDARHDNQGKFEADARYPQAIQVQFRPKDNKVYMSRFRFNCEYGNQFDVLLHGHGTYEEHEHMPLRPKPE